MTGGFYLCLCWGTLTLQNTWLRKTGGSKKLQKGSQTQLVRLLVSSPIYTWRRPETKDALKTFSGMASWQKTPPSVWGLTVKMLMERDGPSPSSSSSCSLETVFAIRLRTKRAGRTTARAPHKNECSRTLLLYATSALHASKRNLELISAFRRPLICVVPTRCFFIAPRRLRMFQVLLKWASEQQNLTCPFLICHWWWNKWDQSPSPADPMSSERPGWWFSQWSDTHRQSGSHSGSAKK